MAVADDLAQIPSNCRHLYADVGTASGEFHCSAVIIAHPLQEAEKNRDDFREVVNDIASLINLVVWYARERDPTSERFVKSCDDFLR